MVSITVLSGQQAQRELLLVVAVRCAAEAALASVSVVAATVVAAVSCCDLLVTSVGAGFEPELLEPLS